MASSHISGEASERAFFPSDLTVWHKNYSLLPVQALVRTRWSSLYGAL